MNEIQSSKNNNNNTRAALTGGDGKAGGVVAPLAAAPSYEPLLPPLALSPFAR